ncbi:MAG: histidine kinase, partial [Coleofasciculus sp. S288]|nr:histidine kinase [Coleofasciculus sp. S288]
ASTLAGAGIGAATGGIVGALVGMGIPEERAKVYNERIKAGDYLLMVSGTENDLRRVQDIMRDRNVEEFGIYDAPDLVDAGAAPRRERVAEREVVAERREVNAEAIDLEGDNEAEVFIVDERDRIR